MNLAKIRAKAHGVRDIGRDVLRVVAGTHEDVVQIATPDKG